MIGKVDGGNIYPDKTYTLVDCAQKAFEEPQKFVVPPKEILEQLRPGDLAYLIFQKDDGQGERMWVVIDQIEKESGSFIGKLGNKPTVITNLQMGDEIRFSLKHIANVMSKEEDERIQESIRTTGLPPEEYRSVTIDEIEQTINKFFELSGKNVSGVGVVFQISDQSKQGMGGDLEKIKQDFEKTKDQDAMQASLIMGDAYYMFLFLILNIVSVQVYRNIPDSQPGLIIGDKDYLEELRKVLERSLKLFFRISDSHLFIVEEFRNSLQGMDEVKRIPIQDLPNFFGSIIDESLERVEKALAS